MRLTYVIILLVLTMAMLSAEAKKKKKGKSNKKPPQWRPNSMPLSGTHLLFVDEGESVTFDCKAKGKPRPQITWYFNEQMLSKGGSTVIRKSGEVTLEGVTPERSGNYTCIVENTLGSMEWTYHLKVQEKQVDIMMQGPRNVTALAGNRAQFTCQVLNDPQADIMWYKGRVEARNFLPTGPVKEILVLEDLTKADEGMYGCQASNLWTSKTKDAYLHVIEPRVPERTKDDMVTVVPWYTDVFGVFSTPNTRNPDDQDSMYLSTKKPRRNGNKKNRKNKKKDRKNKKNKGQPKYDFEDTDRFDDKDNFDTFDNRDNFGTGNHDNNDNFDNRDNFDNFDNSDAFNFDETDMYGVSTRKPSENPTVTPKSTQPKVDPTLVVWEFDKDKVNVQGGRDGKGMNKDTRLTNFNEDKTPVPQGDKTSSGSISSWTIYTIVGAVGGVVLLIGLVAITLTLCCNKEDGGVYKSTSV